MGTGPTIGDKLEGFAKSTQDKAHDILNWIQKSNHHSPIEILKRLQREAFSDIMKLKDRQEKVERLLTYKSSKGNLFQESTTRVKGKVDTVGALLFMDDVDELKHDAIHRSGIRTGIDARLVFETGVREKDNLVAEFIASAKGQGGDVLGGGPLSLAKVFYKAHVNDWFSAIAIPVGAQCRDFGIPISSHQETTALSTYSEFGPPLLNHEKGSAFGIIARKSNMVASMAQIVSGIGQQVNPDGIARTLSTVPSPIDFHREYANGCSYWCIKNKKRKNSKCEESVTQQGRTLSTFGQIVWQLPGNTKLSLLGVHKESRPSNQNISVGALSLPVSIFKRNRFSETAVEEVSSTSTERRGLGGSIALMVNSELDEGMRIGGWVETNNSHPRNLQWAVTMCDDAPEDLFGWGLTLGGLLKGPTSLEHFQVETYLNLNLGRKFKLQPALVYVRDGPTQFPALMLRSSWEL